jgi:hypothetical protein
MTVLTGGALPVSRFIGNPLDQIAGLAAENAANFAKAFHPDRDISNSHLLQRSFRKNLLFSQAIAGITRILQL